MRLVITGGGTGGHLAIAKSLAQEFLSRKIELIYIGSQRGQDRAWFEESPLFSKRIFLPSQGVVNKKGLAKVAALGTILSSAYKVAPIIKEAQGVVSVGGFSAAPASFAAVALAKPLFIHEQNAHIGALNRLLKPFAKRLFCSFLPPYDPYPVQEIFFQKARLRTKLQTVIFLGGSQGASAINRFALKIAPLLHQRGVQIIHQTGAKEYEAIKQSYQNQNIPAYTFAFSKDIASLIAQADFAISRAGASTAWELAANGLPALFIPYPYAAADHQYHNARYFVEKKGALLLRQEELSPAILETIFRSDLRTMSQNLLNLAQPQGAAKIAQEILSSV